METHSPTSANPQIRELIHEGLGMFNRLEQIDSVKFPLKLTMTLMAVCVKGEITANVDLEHLHMKPDSILVLRPGRVLNNIMHTPDFQGYFLLVEQAKLDSFMPVSSSYLASCYKYFSTRPVVSVSSEEALSLVALHTLLRRKNHADDQPYSRLVFHSLCEALFYETLGIYTARISRTSRVPSRREEVLSKFLELVEHNYKIERSVKFYADRMGLTSKHLSVVVKSASGKSAGQLIDNKVIMEAKMMLRNSPKTIQQISVDLNFPNQSFFGKYFKNKTGMSPRLYRSHIEDEP